MEIAHCLHQKTSEDTWTTVKLCKNPLAAAQRLERILASAPREVLQRAKQRLNMLTDVGQKASNLTSQVAVNKKTEKRECKRERKAEKNARVEDSIGQEPARESS
eukprot:symbB.v1.2.013944.t1/scaffold1003.1/size206925/4